MTGDDFAFLAIAALPFVVGVASLWFFRTRVLGHTPGVGALLVGNALLLGLSLSLLTLGFESYYRFVYDTTDGDARTKVSRRWFERHWRTNAMQLRDDVEYALAVPPGKRRITVFGDSFTAGHGVADVGDRFVNRMRAARPDWDVQAMAVLGSSTQSQLEALRRLMRQGYELDVVVLAYVFNDLEPFVEEVQPIYDQMREPAPGWLEPAIEHSYLANMLFYRWRGWQTASGTADDDYFAILERAYEGPAWERERLLLKEFVGTVQSGGGRFLAMTFPLLVHLGRGEPEDHPMHAKLDALWRELGVPHLDLLPVFDTHRGPALVVSRFDDHPSALAHGLTADALAERLDLELGSRDEIPSRVE